MIESMSQSTPHHDDFMSTVVLAAKRHLNADIGFLAEFRGSFQFTQQVASDKSFCNMAAGQSIPFSETYCYQLMAGKIPNVVNDARKNPIVCDLGVTKAMNIGGYVGVPVPLSDGSIYGTLCCVLHEPAGWGEKDLRYLQTLAEIIGTHIGQQRKAEQDYSSKRRRIAQVIRSNHVHMVYQPIVELATGRIVGAEALARFDAEPARGPDKWFAEASEVGLGSELEIHALKLALQGRNNLPRGAYLSVNVSPETLQSDTFLRAASKLNLRNIVIEITEHQIVMDYEPLCFAIAQLKKTGAHIAIDDVGAGYSGLSHILKLQPDILKLDRELVSGIHDDPSKQALAAAVATFAARTSVRIVAEGIETVREMKTLRILGITYGQGYHFAKPTKLPFEEETCEQPQITPNYRFGYAG